MQRIASERQELRGVAASSDAVLWRTKRCGTTLTAESQPWLRKSAARKKAGWASVSGASVRGHSVYRSRGARMRRLGAGKGIRAPWLKSNGLYSSGKAADITGLFLYLST